MPTAHAEIIDEGLWANAVFSTNSGTTGRWTPKTGQYDKLWISLNWKGADHEQEAKTIFSPVQG
jgi:hypothetical protein